jgi:hypothetical protein
MDNSILFAVGLLEISLTATKVERGMFLEKIVLFVVEILTINLPKMATVIMPVITPGKLEVVIPGKLEVGIVEQGDLTFGMMAGSLIQGISVE